MADVLKGNFTPRKRVEVTQGEEALTAKFEREALRRLGGSIAFVSKKKFLYDPGTEEAGGRVAARDQGKDAAPNAD